MKKHDVRLQRLFEAVKAAPPADEEESMPGRLRARVLADWRASGLDTAGHGLALLFRGALICAGVVMLASVAWSFGELAYDPENDVATANYELREDVMR